MYFKIQTKHNFLGDRWLRLSAPNTRGPGLIPGQGTIHPTCLSEDQWCWSVVAKVKKDHTSAAGDTGLTPGQRTKVPHAAQCCQKINLKQWNGNWHIPFLSYEIGRSLIYKYDNTFCRWKCLLFLVKVQTMFPFWSRTRNPYGTRIHVAVDLAFPLLGRGRWYFPAVQKP